jgi:FKBP-type peptidyl-prolyl cis-trans isomerase
MSLRRQKPEPRLEQDENGQNILTKEWVMYQVEQAGGYSNPELNTSIVLQYTGKFLFA